MLFCGRNNSIDIDVLCYQFPDSPKSQKGDYNFDSNWLLLSVCYTEDGVSVTEEDACLLADELSDLYDELYELRDCQTGSYISDFMEPYLRFAVFKNEELYSIAVHYAYYIAADNCLGKWKVCSTVSTSEYECLLEDIKSLAEKYPQR